MKASSSSTCGTVRRRIVCSLASLLTMGLGACQRPSSATPESKTMSSDKTKDVVYFDVSTLSYIERPIFEVKLNGTEVGSGGGALMTGVAVPLGPQVVTWRLGGPEGMQGNGETVRAINQPVLSRPDPKMSYLGVHIYPDNSVELIPEPFWPQRTPKGDAMNREWVKKHGQ